MDRTLSIAVGPQIELQFHVLTAPGYQWNDDLSDPKKEAFESAFNCLESALNGVVGLLPYSIGGEIPLALYKHPGTVVLHLKYNGITEWEVKFHQDGYVEYCDDINAPVAWEANTWEDGFKKFLDMLREEAATDIKNAAQRFEVLSACTFT